jgi:hypothetical protein
MKIVLLFHYTSQHDFSFYLLFNYLNLNLGGLEGL